MRAAVIRQPGPPSVLKVEDWPIPTPQKGQVLIRIKACGLNRSELFTRRGDSGDAVPFPRVLGIECCGLVSKCPGGEFAEGAIVATAMGGLGRKFDGGYAEYTCVPVANVVKLGETKLEWKVLGAVPEMLQTAYGSLFRSLKWKAGETLLVRGGTTSVGLAAAAIAKKHGAKAVIGTSRKSGREELMKGAGMDHIVIDSGSVAAEVRKLFPDGVDKVLELVGTTSLRDSLRCVKTGGVCCMTGIVGNAWAMKEFSPFEDIPTEVYFTTYQGDQVDFVNTPLGEMIQQIQKGEMPVQIGKVFGLEDIAAAHEVMEENKAGGKVVVVMW